MQAVIFDFGNVVGFFDHRLTLDRLAPHTDMAPAEVFQTVYVGQLEDDFESGRIGRADFLRRMRELCRLRCDDDFLAAAIADIFRPNPEVCELIPLLKKKYRLVLGSNTNEIHAAKFLDQFADVLGHFDELVLSHRIQTRKPKPAFFEHCGRLAGCPMTECLFIDDLPANISGAKAAGMHGLVYQPGQDLKRQLGGLGMVASV